MSVLTGRAALVTGGKRIGAAVAMALAEQGCDVALVYRSSGEEAEATARTIRALDRRVATVRADLSKPDECRRVVAETVSALGRLDILLHLASVYEQVPYAELTDAHWERALAVDLRAGHLCAQAAVPHLRAGGRGRIVLFADWVAASGRPRYTGYLPYYVAKAGVIALTQALALELAPDRILVNAIAPGPIRAPEGTTDEERQAVERATPLGHWGGEGEIVKAVLFLIETDFVTGETIRVDGGRHVR
ncbi:MAG TPA: SDR family NAD(P)-dependent oxidoreductase [Vicinamibacterales bacterium]|nr:SDR family NAD(P)-dependent oxidoreductase [Vicinamibacterales bacterium]